MDGVTLLRRLTVSKRALSILPPFLSCKGVRGPRLIVSSVESSNRPRRRQSPLRHIQDHQVHCGAVLTIHYSLQNMPDPAPLHVLSLHSIQFEEHSIHVVPSGLPRPPLPAFPSSHHTTSARIRITYIADAS